MTTPAGITLFPPHPDITTNITTNTPATAKSPPTNNSYRESPEEEYIDYSEEEVEGNFNYGEEEEDCEIILEQDPSFDAQGNAISELKIYNCIQ